MKNFIETYLVDSFTDQPFKGNPAAVCLLKTRLPDQKMQSIAKELGFSETAFVLKGDKRNSYSIRYFSPKMEIPLCGHATLAASKALFEKNSGFESITFNTIEKIKLVAKRNGEEIKMEFPVYETRPTNVPAKLLSALGIDIILNSAYNEETNILLLEIDSSRELQKLTPDFESLIRAHQSINGVLVTAPSKREYFDFESRYFWPWSGTNEDPVTGGTHTFLAKYWGDRLKKKNLRSFQCSERTGFMSLELIDDNRLLISSQAQIILKGELRI